MAYHGIITVMFTNRRKIVVQNGIDSFIYMIHNFPPLFLASLGDCRSETEMQLTTYSQFKTGES